MLGDAFRQFLRYLRYVHLALQGVILAVFILVAVNSFLITEYTVEGQSMAPTLSTGQHLLVNKTAFFNRMPVDGEVVIVSFSPHSQLTFVKRIVAVAGEEATMSDGQRIMLKAGELFVEGDNRSYSTDSRSYGPIMTSQLIGNVVWPILIN